MDNTESPVPGEDDESVNSFIACVPVHEETDGLKAILELKASGKPIGTVVILDSKHVVFGLMAAPLMILAMILGLGPSYLVAIGAGCALGTSPAKAAGSAIGRVIDKIFTN